MKQTRTVRIGIDALGINTEGGGRTSILNLLHKLFLINAEWQFVVYLSKFEKELDFENVTQVVLPLQKGIWSRLLVQLFLPFDALRRKINLVHFTKSQASLLFGIKSILTVHDVTILFHPEIHPKTSVFYWRHVQPFMARKMDAIVAVSNDGAKGIAELLKVQKQKIHVIFNSSQFSEDMISNVQNDNEKLIKYGLPENFMLVLGQIALKKNLNTLIEAIQILKKRKELLSPLILIGPRYSISDASDVIKLIDTLGLSNNVKYLGAVAREDLLTIFRHAELLLMPSVHEGFGIPCLEAMQLGVPLIASNASALPEVIGDAGMLIDDCLNPVVWANAIQTMENSEELRKKYIEKGLVRAKLFSWDQSAKDLSELYCKILEIPYCVK